MKDLQEKTFRYILAGFGFVAGLAWNDAIKALIDYIFPRPGYVLFSKFVYAFLITALAVLAGIYLMRVFKNK